MIMENDRQTVISHSCLIVAINQLTLKRYFRVFLSLESVTQQFITASECRFDTIHVARVPRGCI